jgi:hypothetical protein
VGFSEARMFQRRNMPETLKTLHFCSFCSMRTIDARRISRGSRATVPSRPLLIAPARKGDRPPADGRIMSKSPKPWARRVPRGRSTVKLTPLRRCLRAVADSGIPHRIEVDPVTGRIVLIPTGEPGAAASEPSDWDAALGRGRK